MMNSETEKPRQMIKMTIQKTCKRPPTMGAKNNQTSKQN